MARRKEYPPRPENANADGPLAATLETGRDHVRVVLRDQSHAWVYWEVTADGVADCRRNLRRFTFGAQLVLRVRSGGPGDSLTHRSGAYDIPIDDWLGACCVLLGPSGVPHFCSVGLRSVEGQPVFVPIARSNTVVPPPPRAPEDDGPLLGAGGAEGPLTQPGPAS